MLGFLYIFSPEEKKICHKHGLHPQTLPSALRVDVRCSWFDQIKSPLLRVSVVECYLTADIRHLHLEHTAKPSTVIYLHTVVFLNQHACCAPGCDRLIASAHNLCSFYRPPSSNTYTILQDNEGEVLI